MMDIHIIYHSRDLDGVGSAAIVMNMHSEFYINLIPWDYGEAIPSIGSGSIVFMVDCCFPVKDMKELMLKTNLTWIDHHYTQINAMEEAGLDPIGLREVGRAAIELTWEFLYKDIEIPDGLLMLGIYDTFRKKDKSFLWDEEIFPFQYGMRTYGLDPKKFPLKEIMYPKNQEFIHAIQDRGVDILVFLDGHNDFIAKTNAFEYNIDGLNCICINTNLLATNSFKSVYDPKKHDAMCAFKRHKGHWTVSLYSDKEEVNVGDTCKNRGGGGHHGAAGFQLEKISDLFKHL